MPHKLLSFLSRLERIYGTTPPETSMRLLIRNARILTMAGGDRPRRGAALRELGVIEHGDVLVSEGKIEALGARLDAPEGAEVVDAAGRVLMPGFVDCHTRACWAGDRLGEWEQTLRGVSRREILQAGGGAPAIVRAVRAETRKQLAARLKPRLDAMLREGTTTVEVKSGYGLAVAEEMKMLEAIGRASNEWPGTVVPTALLGAGFEGSLDDYARMVVKEMLPEVARVFPDIAVDAICDRDAWTVEACVRLFEKARKYHPIRVHTDRFNSLGMIPEAVRLGARSVDQLEAASKADLLQLAQSPAVIGVILPCTGFESNQRYARAGFLVDAGGAVALATGCGPEAAPTHSMPLAIALAVRHCGLTPAEAIAACTVNAAAVLNLRGRGTIEAGQRADLILLRHRDERLLAWEFGGNPVDLVICAGRRIA
jgi:imidazolonepropionase